MGSEMIAKILVVEDEIITAMELKLVLEHEGYIVPDLISSGELAVKKALEIQPDLLIMDIQLKGIMDGIEAAEEIQSIIHIPVIYLSAFSGDQILQKVKSNHPFGCIKEPYDIISKPFEVAELNTKIQKALEKQKRKKIPARGSLKRILVNKSLVNESRLSS
jgi:two-component system, response regulator PdtaR